MVSLSIGPCAAAFPLTPQTCPSQSSVTSLPALLHSAASLQLHLSPQPPQLSGPAVPDRRAPLRARLPMRRRCRGSRLRSPTEPPLPQRGSPGVAPAGGTPLCMPGGTPARGRRRCGSRARTRLSRWRPRRTRARAARAAARPRVIGPRTARAGRSRCRPSAAGARPHPAAAKSSAAAPPAPPSEPAPSTGQSASRTDDFIKMLVPIVVISRSSLRRGA